MHETFYGVGTILFTSRDAHQQDTILTHDYYSVLILISTAHL